MRNMIAVLMLIAVITIVGCNLPDVIVDEIAAEFDRGHCEATNFLSTFQAEFGREPMAGDWSIYIFMWHFQIPTIWTETGEIVTYEEQDRRTVDFIWYTEPDYSRYTPYILGVEQAMRDWS